MISEKLQEKLKTLPPGPGVYFHKNAQNEIIYVGKAARLKSRVRQYFQKAQKDPKTEALRAEIADVEWRETETEMEALFLESEMIKRYRPKWNVLLKDDKNVSFVRIDLEEEVPTVTLTRQPAGDVARYIGPFYAAATIKKALRILRRIWPFYEKKYDGKKSLETDLGLTPGIEVGKCTPAEYKKMLKFLLRYLDGDRQNLTRDLEKEMKAAAAAERFEEAARLRNQLAGLNGLRKKIVFSDREWLDLSSDRALADLQKLLKLSAPPRRIEGYDISHLQGTDVVASMVVFTNGVADRAQYRKFKLKTQQNNDFANLAEVLTRRLRHQEWARADLLLIDGGKPQLMALERILLKDKIPYIGLAKEFETIVAPKIRAGKVVEYQNIQIAQNTHVVKLLQRIRDEAHRFAITYHRQLRSKRI